MTRAQKRINIILVFLLIGIALAGIVYFMSRSEMTCSDGVKNQGEEKVDCGGPCSPCQESIRLQTLKIRSVESVKDGRGKRDVVITILNPNQEYGAKSFQFQVYNQEKGVNSGRIFTDFILPGEKKEVIVNNIESDSGNLVATINRGSIKWWKIVRFVDPNLVIYNKKYRLFNSGAYYAEITGLLINKSDADYENIKVKGILRDKEGNLLGASYHIINTLPSGHKRDFHIIFPTKLPGQVYQSEVSVETNIFDVDNYVKVEGRVNYIDQ